jgi:hypothetical protein
MIKLANIHSELLNDAQRLDIPARLYGLNFSLKLEPAIYSMADMLAPAYLGGYWHFYTLSNGGWYMAPATDTIFDVSCENGFDGKLSADALGVTACLYAYSHLSFGEGEFAQVCAEHYHLLRPFLCEHAEAKAIFRAID